MTLVTGDVILADGSILTEEMMDRIAEDAERGILPGKPGKYLIGPPGRPRLSDEDLVTVAFKVPRSKREEMDEAAARRDQTRSEFLRDALDAALASA